MIAAVDSNILFDVLLPNPDFLMASTNALSEARAAGALLICEVVIAEIRPFLPDDSVLLLFMDSTGLRFSPISFAGAAVAGSLWAERTRGAIDPRRAVADFLIAGHAMTEAGRLLTRDQEFLRLPLEDLQVIIPGA